MSWRDAVRAAVEREAQGAAQSAEEIGERDNGADPTALADAWAEREAIAVVDGRLPAEWAASLSRLEQTPRPAGISERDWRERLDKAWTRADLHGAELAANGWTFEEVFGVGESWLCLSARGAGWLVQDARIVEITPDQIVFQRGRERSTHRKLGRPH